MARPLLTVLMHAEGRSVCRRPISGLARLLRLGVTVSVVAVVAGPAIYSAPASAQVSGEQVFAEDRVEPAAQMLLEADELVYDEPSNSVAAVGNVQIAYDEYTLVADRVTYYRGSGRVLATGAVEIIEPNGNRIFAEEIDVTDDFQDGFVSALRVETADNTRFAAESAERREGEIAVFNNGVYTACEPCRKNPAKPPAWQIRANRVIINNRTKTVEYEGASFEVFGRPIAYLPRFSHADPSIRRKSGFLFPRPSYSDELGFGVRNAYFWALAPHFDLTLSGTYHTRQGFLGEAEWRHRTALGEYNFRIAGIDQQGPDEFDADTIDRREEGRVAVMSTGQFELNPRWKFGWNALWQTDENFARTYDLDGFAGRGVTNQVYLTGLNDKNHFDLRAQKFLIQDDDEDQLVGPLFPGDSDKRQEQQARVIPSFDYNIVSDRPVAGGQVAFDVNVTHVKRDLVDIVNYDGVTPLLDNGERFYGITGNYTRASIESEWKASTIAPNGAVITTSLSGRGDAMLLDTDDLATPLNPLTSNDNVFRGMPAAMLEIRYPLVASDGFTSHIFEPIAQVIARPDETHIGEFPNEDAQSFVFDTSNLFERDKFSGYDRVEGGTRANLGFRYAASFTNGTSLDVVAGQSFHLAGQNSFAERDLVNAGLDSGLETDRSDYVASADFNTGVGLTVGVAGRFDEHDAEVKRGEARVRYAGPDFSLASSYIFIDEQPKYGLPRDRHEVNGSASVKLTDRIRLFGSASFDIERDELYRRGFGVAYDDSCTSLSVAYHESDDRYTGDSIERTISFRLGLRTIGDIGHSRRIDIGDDDDG